MNIIIAILIILAFLLASIYFVYLTCKNIDKNNTTDSFTKDILDQAKGRNIRDIDTINKTIQNFYPVLQKVNNIQAMDIAADSKECTRDGDDMFASGKCHWCCNENSHSYINTETKTISCYADDDRRRPESFVKFEQDPCSCTKETEDIKQYGVCYPCCDNLNMYMSTDGSKRTQCFTGTGTVSGYTYLPGNKCELDPQNPIYPKYPLIDNSGIKPKVCTKEGEDIKQYQTCLTCCEGLNMYTSTDSSKQTKCFSGTGPITGYTYLPGNKCDSDPTYHPKICTKENRYTTEFGVCYPCCDNLNMYNSTDDTELTQCFSGTGPITGYTYLPGNKCD